jgi:hypothetical protein
VGQKESLRPTPQPQPQPQPQPPRPDSAYAHTFSRQHAKEDLRPPKPQPQPQPQPKQQQQQRSGPRAGDKSGQSRRGRASTGRTSGYEYYYGAGVDSDPEDLWGADPRGRRQSRKGNAGAQANFGAGGRGKARGGRADDDDSFWESIFGHRKQSERPRAGAWQQQQQQQQRARKQDARAHSRREVLLRHCKGLFTAASLGSDDDSLRRAFRRVLALYHPDKQVGNSEVEQASAAEVYTMLREHYDVLDEMCKR